MRREQTESTNRSFGSAAVGSSSAEGSASLTVSSPPRVLHVEDNPGDARLLREMLLEAEVAVPSIVHVRTLREAMGILGEGSVEAVLLDLGLPDSFGLGTLVKMEASAPEVPIIVLTSLEDEAIGTEAVREGAQDYLIKGAFDYRLLSRSIRYAVERKRTLVELREMEERYRAVATCLEDAIFETTADGRLLFVSPSGRQMLGYDLGEPSGSLFDLVHPADRDRIQAEHQRTLTGGSAGHQVYRFRRKDGGWLRLQSTSNGYQARGKEQRWIVVGRRITSASDLEAPS